jgi:hypothetical protein
MGVRGDGWRIRVLVIRKTWINILRGGSQYRLFHENYKVSRINFGQNNPIFSILEVFHAMEIIIS